MRDRILPELQHSMWLGKNGAPSGISSLAQTSDGLLWLGTEYGLIRFDGTRFTQIDENTRQRYPSETIQSLFASQHGGLWVGFSAGRAVTFIKDGNAVRYPAQGGGSLGTVQGFAEESNGSVWIATVSRGLCQHLAGETVLRCGEAVGLPTGPVSAVYADRHGRVWASTIHELYSRARGIDHFSKVLDGFGYLYAIEEAPDGRVWLADARGPVRVAGLDEQGVPTLKAAVAVESASLQFDADGSLWLSTLGSGLRRLRFPDHLSSGLMSDDAPELEHFTEEHGLSGNYAWPVLVGREGEVWVGTSAGIDRFQQRSLVPANFPAGAHDFSLAAGDDGAVWAGTTNYPLMLLQGRALQEFPEVPREVGYVHRDDDGNVLIAGGNGIYRVRGGHPEQIAPTPAQWDNSQIRSILIDRQRTLWILFSSSVAAEYKREDGQWTQYSPPPEIPRPAVPWAQVLDHSGRIWRSYPPGFVVVSENDRDKVYGVQDGLNIGDPHTLYQGRRHMWIGGSKGLAVFDGDRFDGFTADSPGELDGVSGIVETTTGDIWLRSVAGLFHYDAASVRSALTGQPLHGERFDYLDGLPGQSAQVSPLPTLIQGTDGRLWLATGSGVVWIDPTHLVRNSLPPPVRIESIESGERHLPLSETVVLPSRLNRVQIGYTAAALRVPERIRFRYKLDGVDPDWQEAGARREVLYNNLAPGRYRFSVIAANEDGVWDPQAATLLFEVPPMVYQTAWFRTLCGLAGLLILAAAYRLRMRSMLARVNLLHQERLVERERIARDLHDTLLQGVQGLIIRFQATVLGMREGDPVRAEIESTLLRANRVLEEGRDKVINLRLVSESEAGLEQAWSELAKEFAPSQGPAFELTVEGSPRPLMPLIQDEVHRIGAEAIINAFQHAQARRVEVEIGYGPSGFRVRIRDDGRGIPEEVLNSGGRPGHWGLPGMRERARRMRAKLMLLSKPDAGTEVELRVPGSVAYGDASQKPWRRLLSRLRGPAIGRRARDE